MEEPFYGNGAGVQMPLPFEGEETSPEGDGLWLEVPYRWANVDALIEAWAYCSRRRQGRSTYPYPLWRLLEKS